MDYQAPINDILFNIKHLSSWPLVRSLPEYTAIDEEDIIAVLTEFSRFSSEIIAPLAHVGDENGAILNEQNVIMPEQYVAAYKQFVDMGWQSLTHTSEFGGMGFPLVAGAAATEILNSADMSFGLCPLLTDSAIHAIEETGSHEQKEQYLEKLISGEWSGTMNLTEPQAGSDLSRIRCKAEKHQDGSYRITGTKIFITYGEHDLSSNIVHLVLARTKGAPAGIKGLSLFIVPKYLESTDGSHTQPNGVSCVGIEHKLGVRASPTAVLEYENATGYLVGEENHGINHMFVMMAAARFSVGVQGVAISERAYQQASFFASERVQGQSLNIKENTEVPINHHPDVQRMLMRMRAFSEGGRALSYATAGWIDLAKNENKERRKVAKGISEFLVPLVKGFCTEKSVEVTSLGIQIHGGMGYIEETGVAQLLRDARILPIYEGTTAIQANDLLGRKVLRDGGQVARQFTQMIAETENALRDLGPETKSLADHLLLARNAFEDSLAWLLETAPKNINLVYAGSQPFLMLAGNLAVGWQFGRSVLAAKFKLQNKTEVDFMTQKIATASFYMQHILIDCIADRSRIIEGAESLKSVEF